MSNSIVPLCSCNTREKYFCLEDQSYFCLKHSSTNHCHHTIYFNTKNLDPRLLKSILNGLESLKSGIKEKLQKMTEKIQKIVDEVKNVYNTKYNESMKMIGVIDSMIEDFHKTNEFIRAYPIIQDFEENEEKALFDLQNRFEIKFNEKKILREIPKILMIYSSIDEISSRNDENVKTLSEKLKESKKRAHYLYEQARIYTSSQRFNNNILDWFRSIRVKRNLEKFCSICINGENISNLEIDLYSYIPQLYYIKKISLCNFSDLSLAKIVNLFVSQCNYIEKLKIENCDIEKNICEKIANKLSECKNISEVVIHQCRAGDFITQIIMKIDFSSIITLVLSSNYIADEGIIELSKFFPRMV